MINLTTLFSSRLVGYALNIRNPYFSEDQAKNLLFGCQFSNHWKVSRQPFVGKTQSMPSLVTFRNLNMVWTTPHRSPNHEIELKMTITISTNLVGNFLRDRESW
jgi:hypothetical protein